MSTSPCTILFDPSKAEIFGKGEIFTVQGEEEYMVSHLNSFLYVEMDGEFIETPFQHFEEVSPDGISQGHRGCS